MEETGPEQINVCREGYSPWEKMMSSMARKGKPVEHLGRKRQRHQDCAGVQVSDFEGEGVKRS